MKRKQIIEMNTKDRIGMIKKKVKNRNEKKWKDREENL